MRRNTPGNFVGPRCRARLRGRGPRRRPRVVDPEAPEREREALRSQQDTTVTPKRRTGTCTGSPGARRGVSPDTAEREATGRAAVARRSAAAGLCPSAIDSISFRLRTRSGACSQRAPARRHSPAARRLLEAAREHRPCPPLARWRATQVSDAKRRPLRQVSGRSDHHLGQQGRGRISDPRAPGR